ncbi:hypothetical protein F9B85_13755 [Heliorestis acidaminivorans]|uniref:Uncharacterized protein n=1 Tax=Heliorestis acidaminivorans TaxID=553427 RepID=A0A6I0EYY4_9FIRM|nr:hypothetical protein [Heliorestis acidaminivorans]KAB2950888.1 hypothetical protein F9B85_13755 [Heliorestis acidaminivorans]
MLKSKKCKKKKRQVTITMNPEVIEKARLGAERMGFMVNSKGNLSQFLEYVSMRYYNEKIQKSKEE